MKISITQTSVSEDMPQVKVYELDRPECLYGMRPPCVKVDEIAGLHLVYLTIVDKFGLAL
jgi:hypothetical protein